MSEEKQKRLKARLNRIAGQIGGVQRMVDEDRYCVDILTQISAIRSALDTVGVELLTDHIQGCVVGHGTGTAHARTRKMTPDELVDEVKTSIGRFLK